MVTSSPSDIDISIDERKWIFKCRVNDIDIRGNFRWKYESIYCTSCNDGSEETQEHLLSCNYLLGKSEIITYIPNYIELYEGDLTDQLYVARLLRDNYARRVTDNSNV